MPGCNWLAVSGFSRALDAVVQGGAACTNITESLLANSSSIS